MTQALAKDLVQDLTQALPQSTRPTPPEGGSEYQVIARKWRPQFFADLVGQSHISQTLYNALKTGRLPHALLFTGPRGTGKTSTARILAKSLKCPQAQDFVPCNSCATCREISTGVSVDIIEIDGASNNSVDNIRELRDNIGYMPSQGKYKVYIIDEVHMLSTSAFNALLKTIEEPPAHVVFIFATTEVNKIPQTILSRCQRFDFRRLSTRQIQERLEQICKSEAIRFDSQALWLIARQGDGSMRDSQTLLDQVFNFSQGQLTAEEVARILGLTDRQLLNDALQALVSQNSTATLEVLERFSKSGYDPTLFVHDLLEGLRNLLFLKFSSGTNASGTHASVTHVSDATVGGVTGGNPTGHPLVDLPESEIEFLSSLQLAEEDIHFLFDMALKGATDVARAQDPRLVLDMLLLRMVAAPRIRNLGEYLQNFNNSVPPSSIPSVAIPAKQVPRPSAPPRSEEGQKLPKKDLPKSEPPHKAEPNKPDSHKPEQWVDVVSKIRAQDALFGAKIDNLQYLGLQDKTLTLGIPPHLKFLADQMTDPQQRKKLSDFVQRFWAEDIQVVIKNNTTKEAGLSALETQIKKDQDSKSELRKQIEDHPKMKTIKNVFSGEIISIKQK